MIFLRSIATLVTFVTLLGLLGFAPAPLATAAEATPDGRTLLPKLTDETGNTEATGRILNSTRGKPGPVRLVIELKDGEALAVLVAPDDLCTHLGLSLQPGEEITVIGKEVKGSRPLLVARTVIEKGRRIAIRDAEGHWLRAPREGAPEEPAPAPAPSVGLPEGE